MHITIRDQRFEIPDHIVLGICRVCGLPIVTGEIYDYLIEMVNDKILFHLVNGLDNNNLRFILIDFKVIIFIYRN